MVDVDAPRHLDYSPEVIRTLMSTFWTGAGWRRPPSLPAQQDFERAVEAGIMFTADDKSSHDVWVARAQAAARRLTLDEVRAGFIASLASRRLDLRSALSSYIVACALPSHSFDSRSPGRSCPVCDESAYPVDLNVLNFERFKWGGVRKLDISYIAFDLEQFERAPRLIPTSADIELLENVVGFIRALPPSTTTAQLANVLKLVPGNKAERGTLLESLGIVGILDTPDHPGFLRQFTTPSDRHLPNRHYIDTLYPACWWTAADGVNDIALAEVLGLAQ